MTRTALIATLLLSPLASSPAFSREPDFEPAKAVQACVSVLGRAHISQRPLDEQLSRDWLASFFGQLDPRRMYFLEADFQEFRRYEDRLLELARQHDLQLPELVQARFQLRVQQATAHVQRLLAAEQDFTVDETCPLEYDRFAPNRSALEERWRLQLKAELLIEKVHGRPLPEVVDQLRERYRRVSRQTVQMTEEQLISTYIDSLCNCFDHRCAYLGPTLLESYTGSSMLRDTHRSLGLYLRQQAGRLVIADVHNALRGSARRSELTGMALIGIRRVGGKLIDLVEMPIRDGVGIIQSIEGPLQSDTEVILELLDPVTLKRTTMTWPRLRPREYSAW